MVDGMLTTKLFLGLLRQVSGQKGQNFTRKRTESTLHRKYGRVAIIFIFLHNGQSLSLLSGCFFSEKKVSAKGFDPAVLLRGKTLFTLRTLQTQKAKY